MRLTALYAVVALSSALVLPACAVEELSGRRGAAGAAPLEAPEGYRAELHPGIWALERVSRDGTEVWISDAESGCNDFHHTRVSEVEGGLRIVVLDRVLVPVKKKYGCLLYLRPARHRIALPRPLGGDEILGECVPGDSTGEQRICALMHEAARNS